MDGCGHIANAQGKRGCGRSVTFSGVRPESEPPNSLQQYPVYVLFVKIVGKLITIPESKTEFKVIYLPRPIQTAQVADVKRAANMTCQRQSEPLNRIVVYCELFEPQRFRRPVEKAGEKSAG